jgi:uncharacterized protein Yka (UPF0111/DUF47 family)
MQKTQAVASMGQRAMLLPAWIKAALAANDRLKLYLSVLQAAAAHAEQPEGDPLDFSRDMAAAGVQADWLRELPSSSTKLDGVLVIPQLPRLAQRLAEDLAVMARPLLESGDADEPLRARVRRWSDVLGALRGEQLAREALQSLTRGRRALDKEGEDDDSLHLLVMDLHKRLNRLAATVASEQIDGAHVWQLRDGDRPLVAAFMRGLNRTAPLKLDHPGLDTAATRDGERLLLQNDIGTNDAHVLVLQVEERSITLNYSDLHRTRFQFMQSLLAPLGAQWSALQARVDAALNAGEAFTFGSARFECADARVLETTLEGIVSRVVFLIDWNRARKRLLPFVGKAEAIDVLAETSRRDVGHVAWLKAGGERLIFDAMQAAGQGAFRIGDRLDDVLGAADARGFLVEVLSLCSQVLRAGQPAALAGDETRLLLARRVRQHRSEFELLEEHAAFCHALAQAVSDSLAHATSREDAPALAARAKVWERQADHLVMRARERAQRQPRWRPFARLLELSDDVADALEESAFLIELIADDHRQAWADDVRQVLSRLAQAVLSATQEHVKAVAIAHGMSDGGDAADGDAFLAATWNVLRSERQCDELLRTARRALLRSVRDAPALMLANDLALTLELASDRLLVAAYALRDVAFEQAGARQ